MDPEQPGGLTGSRIFGIPVIVLVAGIAVLAYFYFRSRSGSSSGINTSGGGGSASSGTTRLEKGAVRIDITQNPQPKPPVRGRRPGHHKHGKHPGSQFTLHAGGHHKGPPRDVIGPLHKPKHKPKSLGSEKREDNETMTKRTA